MWRGNQLEFVSRFGFCSRTHRSAGRRPFHPRSGERGYELFHPRSGERGYELTFSPRSLATDSIGFSQLIANQQTALTMYMAAMKTNSW